MNSTDFTISVYVKAKLKVKINQSHYRPGDSQRIQES